MAEEEKFRILEINLKSADFTSNIKKGKSYAILWIEPNRQLKLRTKLISTQVYIGEKFVFSISQSLLLNMKNSSSFSLNIEFYRNRKLFKDVLIGSSTFPLISIEGDKQPKPQSNYVADECKYDEYDNDDYDPDIFNQDNGDHDEDDKLYFDFYDDLYITEGTMGSGQGISAAAAASDDDDDDDDESYYTGDSIMEELSEEDNEKTIPVAKEVAPETTTNVNLVVERGGKVKGNLKVELKIWKGVIKLVGHKYQAFAMRYDEFMGQKGDLSLTNPQCCF